MGIISIADRASKQREVNLQTFPGGRKWGGARRTQVLDLFTFTIKCLFPYSGSPGFTQGETHPFAGLSAVHRGTSNSALECD